MLLTRGAEQDLEAIVDYISEVDGPVRSSHVVDQFTGCFERLSSMPERGGYPRELLSLGNKEYRQVFFKPYRIIYRVSGKTVIVYVIADSRRDLQSLLSRRLLGA
ncbi:MAG: type II toxin-antitoxin system RelE/ParE family toxin [Betaproteobacteria bacterium]|nr:type II toxin-antitoxin system RelE/ParE family toxin [Betaproteobacteria bacterium]